MTERGRYIVIEGHDGTGKSEQVHRLRRRLGEAGVKICDFTVEEPDGARRSDGTILVPIATELRKIIKNGELVRDAATNLALFSAARHENWQQAMEPALKRGEWVITARSWLSSIAYQGYGQGMDLEVIRNKTLESTGHVYMEPDLEIVLDVHEEVRASRIANRGELELPDTFESMPTDFQTRVKEGYVSYARSRHIPIIDASGSKQQVEELIWQQVKSKLLKGVNYEAVS